MLTGDRRRWKIVDHLKVKQLLYSLEYQRLSLLTAMQSTRKQDLGLRRKQVMGELESRYQHLTNEWRQAQAREQYLRAELSA